MVMCGYVGYMVWFYLVEPPRKSQPTLQSLKHFPAHSTTPLGSLGLNINVPFSSFSLLCLLGLRSGLPCASAPGMALPSLAPHLLPCIRLRSFALALESSLTAEISDSLKEDQSQLIALCCSERGFNIYIFPKKKKKQTWKLMLREILGLDPTRHLISCIVGNPEVYRPIQSSCA